MSERAPDARLSCSPGGRGVTGVDASQEMLRVARERATARGVPVQFAPGDAHALPFGDASFALAVSLRVLMHTPGWRRCVAELCRVARQAVILDYPAAVSAAAIQAMTRRLGRWSGANVEAYRVFADRAIRGASPATASRAIGAPAVRAADRAAQAVGSRARTDAIEGAL